MGKYQTCHFSDFIATLSFSHSLCDAVEAKMGRKSVLQKGKDKVTDGKASSSAGKRKRDSGDDYDDDKTGGRKRKDRSFLQFVDDVAYEVDEDDEEDDDFDFSDSDFFDEGIRYS